MLDISAFSKNALVFSCLSYLLFPPQQNCRMGVNRCSHPGCSEAKLMYLHLKTCSSGDLEPCPTGHKGCQDARKLLAHYRRCRDIRARQAHLPPPARSQQHVCLVCSLVARHAKFTLDRTTSSCRSVNSSKTATSSHFIPSLNLNHDSHNGRRDDGHNSSLLSKSMDGSRGFLSSRSPFSSDPAPPRFAFSRTAGNGGLSGDNSGFQALQAVVSCALGAGPLPSTEDVLEPIHENQSRTVKLGVATGRGFNTRPRSESLDVRRTPSTVPRTTRQLQQGQNRHQEKNMSYLYLAAVDSFADDVNTTHVRRRSLSCSVPSSSVPPTGECDTMLQKPIGEELQYILGADMS
jgi:hypothetical protein